MPTDERAHRATSDEGRSARPERPGVARSRGPAIAPAVLAGSAASLLLLGLAGLGGSYDRAATSERLVALAISLGVFLGVSLTARRRGLMWWSVWGYAGLAVGASTLGLAAVEWSLVSEKMPFLSDLTSGLRVRIRTDPPLHPNILAGALLLPLPLTVALPFVAWRRHSRRGVRALATVVATTGALLAASVFLLTQSRTALLALAFTVCVLVLSAARARARGVAAVALIVIVAGGALSIYRAVGERAETGERFGSVEARAEIWKRGISLAAERPLLGIGMDSFSHVVHRLRPFGEGPLASDFIAPDERIGHAHNLYLQTVLDLGALGLVALLALFGSSLAALRQVWREAEARPVRWVATALACGLVGHGLFGIGDAVPLGAKAGVLLWVHLGLVHGLHARVLGGAARP